MQELIKTHLVFGQQERKLIKEINKYCRITGWDSSLEAAHNWAENAGGEAPDLFLVNSTVYFGEEKGKKKNSTKDFLRMLLSIKRNRRKMQIVLLLSEKKIADRELIVNLIKMKIYNFWFLDGFDEDDVQEFVFTRRNLEGVEKYLKDKERDLSSYLKESGSLRREEKIFKPYCIKSNVLTFWSEHHTFLNCGIAFLTALNLAESGFQVALVETVNPVPCLGSIAVNHPYYNTSHALSMYIQGNNDFAKNCLCNSERCLNDSYTTEDCEHVRCFPEELYFLPDGNREDNATEAEMTENWSEFITEFSRSIIFEKGFHFLIFIASGRNFFNEAVLDGVTNTKFITVNMLPSSVLYGLREREKGQGKTYIIGTNNVSYINKQIKGIDEMPFLYPPASFESDFLNYVYFQDYRKISSDTQAFINNLIEIMGVKLPKLDVEKRGMLERLRDYKKAILKSIT